MSATEAREAEMVRDANPDVQVVAHRGSSYDLPEHTEEAFVRAIEDGADALECDVRLTSDGHLICHHDPVLDRTSSGRGRLSDRTLAQLRALEWNSPAGGPLTLHRLFELAEGAGRRVELAVETKHPVRYAGEVDRQVLDLADRFGWAGQDSPLRVMSFSTTVLRRVRGWAPQITTVFLANAVPRWVGLAPSGHLPSGASVVGAGQHLLGTAAPWLARLRERGHDLHVWTVDTPEGVDACLRAGAVAVITNRPRQVLGQIGRGPRAPYAAGPGRSTGV